MFGPQIRAKGNAGVSAGHMTVIMGKSKQSKIAPLRKKGPREAGPSNSDRTDYRQCQQ